MSPDVDVLIVGAGLSGIGAACQLRRRSPGRTFAILEARERVGGTWDLFRYPGVRSDSDMFTMGYRFRPWTAPDAVAAGETVLGYVRDTAREYGVDRHIRLGHRAVRAEWSSDRAQWTVSVERPSHGDLVTYTCAFLYCCTGYYRYDAGYTPPLPGVESFDGTVVHPQHWPDALDWAGKRVVVIGSGATAVTLVPALAERAAHVTMLQRTPSWIVSRSARDRTADRLRRHLPARAAHRLARWRNIVLHLGVYGYSRRRPEAMKRFLRKGVEARLPPGYDVDRHFTPPYDPWDQRLCVVANGDLFRAIRTGRATVVTDHVETFTRNGIRLRSGGELAAELVVTATGLELLALGGLALTVDGRDVDVAETVAYKGTMLSGVPNLALALGYTNASWMLKADLAAEYVCRLLNRMARRGERICLPLAPRSGARLPLIGLSSGYVRRGAARMPKQGIAPPWRLHRNYPRDMLTMRFGRLADAGIRFS
ncbi:monooxygenase [Virgisporangium aliadipatigenens]|uniref:Monooxygenase n=1 Tax=Virgisporangium aliadipatigenens TaxID=741659 RepID=A0A8J3YSJ4_9ACTN|nr:NAD(P)/FAD-dependent oxidoreductase [Virgisporangium aliadipatigenens]GIJ49041.1 monooxygenase [Virgisporangium aliadipatigenens]